MATDLWDCSRNPPCDLPETASAGVRLQAGLGEWQAKDQAEPGRAQDHDARAEGGLQVVQQRRARPHRPASEARGRPTTGERQNEVKRKPWRNVYFAGGKAGAVPTPVWGEQAGVRDAAQGGVDVQAGVGQRQDARPPPHHHRDQAAGPEVTEDLETGP